MFTEVFRLAKAIWKTGITRRAEDYTDSLINRKDRIKILCSHQGIGLWAGCGLFQESLKFFLINADVLNQMRRGGLHLFVKPHLWIKRI
ncbi:hypothetical protein ACQ4OC_14080 [Yersinia sp. J1]|uniref:hypothetical protein n=1 Tax=Yersinia sp. J1 TaxID=3424774 RepID=UPI003D3689C5